MGVFTGFRVRARVEMVDLFKATDPLAELRHLMTTFWTFAKQQSTEKFGFSPNYFHTLIESNLLMEGDISLALFNPKDDGEVFERLMEKLDAVLQSQKAKETQSFLEAPFVVDINAIHIKHDKKHQLAGAGRKRKVKLPPRDGIYSGALMDLPFSDTDNLCLFRYINLLLQKHLKNDSKVFYSYQQRAPHQQKIDVLQMLNWCNIDPELPKYSILDYGDKIQVKIWEKLWNFQKNCRFQEYLNHRWPGIFKIFAFSSSQDGSRPIFKSKDVSSYEKELVVYLIEDDVEPHWVPVLYPGRIFQNKSKYCFTVSLLFSIFYLQKSFFLIFSVKPHTTRQAPIECVVGPSVYFAKGIKID